VTGRPILRVRVFVFGRGTLMSMSVSISPCRRIAGASRSQSSACYLLLLRGLLLREARHGQRLAATAPGPEAPHADAAAMVPSVSDDLARHASN
jgi:hypothetical protein